MATISSLAIKVTASAAGVLPAFRQIEQGAEKVDRKVAGASTHIAAMSAGLRSLALSAATFLGVSGGLFGLGFGVKLAGEAEQAQIAFEVMLGSAEKAARVMADIRATAASTPFETADLVTAGRSLISFQVGAEELIPTLRMLGDLSSGLGIPLNELAQIYGKARVQGRLFMEDINQLTGRGIPIIGELAKQFGVSEGEVRKLVETGKVGFPQLEAAFRSLTGEGGMFAGMMEKQSRTLFGVLSTLKDNVAALFLELGNKGLPILKAAAEGAAALTGALAGTSSGTIKATLQVTALVGSFVLALTYVPRIVAGVRAITLAFKAMATGQAIVAALSGPGGWASLAAGVAIAAASVAGIEYAFASADASIAGATTSAGSFTATAKDAAAAASAIGDSASSLDDYAAAWSKFKDEDGFGKVLEERAAKAKEAAAAMEDLKRRAEQLTESLRTPGEVYADKIAELREMLAAGLLSEGTFSRALEGARKELESSLDRDAGFAATRTVGAAFRGTSAEISARTEGENALKQLLAEEKKAAKLREETVRLLREIRGDKPTREIILKKVGGAV